MNRALVLDAIGGDLRAVERPPLQPGPDDVIIEVRAAGICHSDEHYRSGVSAHIVPLRVFGHEVAGVIARVGSGVDPQRIGERVCVHYVVSCHTCDRCQRGDEQFCRHYQMVGMHRDGGYATEVLVPAVNAIPLPGVIPYSLGAALMCAGATAFHALRRGRLAAGETVMVIGAGGIGLMAVQIARALGAGHVIAVDRQLDKLSHAAQLGATALNANVESFSDAVLSLTEREGVHLALDCVGRPETTRLAIDSLGIRGRAVVVGISKEQLAMQSYADLLARETEVMGSNDHFDSEIRELLELAVRGEVTLPEESVRHVPLDATAVNAALADLRTGRAPVRTFILPGAS